MKKWRIIFEEKDSRGQHKVEDVIRIILRNRGFETKKEIDNFLNPDINDISLKSCLIDISEFDKFKKRILNAIDSNEKIIIFGDYDVDGICSTAILWETLYCKTKSVLPYIPDRVDEGYGLSVKGVENVLSKNPDTKVIITVDNGIVAYDAVDFANSKGIDVIISDHHVKGDRLPRAFCILHTTLLCGAGIAWIISKELGFENKEKIHEKIGLATLATIADLVPLIGNNRAIVREGLEILKQTKRIGLKELLSEAGVANEGISVYAIGHIIAPRLNATGRIQSAMNALRLLCTNNTQKARRLASMLGSINRERQELTQESVLHAKLFAIENSYSSKITVVAHQSYNPGVIGLIASQLVESYYRPAFAISIGENVSKGSARSIKGVNIIELIRSVSHTFIEAGGHPMAAGFSVETKRIEEFSKALAKKADEIVTDEILERHINIDMVLPFELITKNLVSEVAKLEPFGMGNFEPTFATEKVDIVEVRKIGREKNHYKLKISKNGKVFDAVAFKFADKLDIAEGNKIDIVYTIDENLWNGKKTLQLKIRDLRN